MAPRTRPAGLLAERDDLGVIVVVKGRVPRQAPHEEALDLIVGFGPFEQAEA